MEVLRADGLTPRVELGRARQQLQEAYLLGSQLAPQLLEAQSTALHGAIEQHRQSTVMIQSQLAEDEQCHLQMLD